MENNLEKVSNAEKIVHKVKNLLQLATSLFLISFNTTSNRKENIKINTEIENSLISRLLFLFEKAYSDYKKDSKTEKETYLVCFDFGELSLNKASFLDILSKEKLFNDFFISSFYDILQNISNKENHNSYEIVNKRGSLILDQDGCHAGKYKFKITINLSE